MRVVNNWHLFWGGILTMIGSYLVVVHNIDWANFIFLASNALLIWYALCTVEEFYRNFTLATGENRPEKE